MATFEEYGEAPTQFICSISAQVMEDPVFTADGLSYERVMITDWLKFHDTSPRTNLKLQHKFLTPNADLKSLIMEWREKQTISIPPHKIIVDDSEAGLLGVGAWGEVRKGTMRISEDELVPVAVKTISNLGKTSKEVSEMLGPEINILKAAVFSCMHVTKLYGTTIKHDRMCIVMKLYKHTLAKLIKDCGKFIPAVALRHTLAIFRALSELHTAGIVSRDIKPDNILFDEHGSLVISDFGLSFKSMGKGLSENEVKGTLNYMCAEMFGEKAVVTEKVDVYAAACCAVEMLTGKMPFTGAKMNDIKVAVLGGNMPPEASLLNLTNKEFSAIIIGCLHHDPSNRPTAAQVISILEEQDTKVPSLPPPPPPQWACERCTYLSDTKWTTCSGLVPLVPLLCCNYLSQLSEPPLFIFYMRFYFASHVSELYIGKII